MANEAVVAQPSWIDTVGGWVTSAGQIFNAGTEVYVGAKQRIDALKATEEDTVKTTTAAAPKIVTGAPSTAMPAWVIPVAAAVGVLLLIVLFKKTR